MGTVRVETTRFGTLEVDEGRIVNFPLGIPGFPNLKRFFLVDYRDPLKWLQAADDPGVAFIVVDPFLFFPDYSFVAGDDVEEFLQVEENSDLVVLVILTVTEDSVTANLCAPILINASKMIGLQCLLDEKTYPFRAPLPRREKS